MSRRLRFSGLLGVLLVSAFVHGVQQVRADPNPAQKYALLIGVNHYSPPFQDLEFCHYDIELLKEKLIAAGFARENIVLMRDEATEARYWPSRANIDSQLALTLGMANEEDLVIVAFSGHGLHVEGISYICPADAKITQPAETMVSLDMIYQRLEKCTACQKVLLVDACRNEPLFKGIKAPTGLRGFAAGLVQPPKGLRVLASCEAGQWSAEDPNLKHGVFMYYVTEGLDGHADQEYAGNRNDKVSLHELYTYAHEKTKKHVARSHGILQRPVLQGEVVGIFEIAELADRVSESAITSSVAKQHAESVPAPMTRLLQLGDSLRSKGQIDQAIQVYDTVLQQDPNNKVALQRRGAAYLARGREGDVDRALTDQKAAGLPGIKLSIRSTSSELKLGNTATGEVGKGEIVRVTQSNGNWLWVDSVDGNNSLKGWITKEAVIAKRVDAAKPKPSGYQRSSQWTAPRPNTHQFRGSGDRFIDNYIQKHGRPPSIWETPRWESLREIERLRNSGFLR